MLLPLGHKPQIPNYFGILHDGIAAGVFNMKYNGAGAAFGAWDKFLGNTQEVVDLMLTRMQKDYEGLAPRARKPWGLTLLDS